MRIIVDIISAAKLSSDKSPVEVNLPAGSTINDLIVELLDLYGEDFRKRIFREIDDYPYVMFSINGERAELTTELHTDDKVLIVPPVGGG
jgi:molybdopterin converting factor small subunit